VKWYCLKAMQEVQQESESLLQVSQQP
jgi:hypothetical protein